MKIVGNALDAEDCKLCREIKELRNVLIAHPFFVMPLDQTNRYKLGFYDVNNYRKMIRTLYRLSKDRSCLSSEEERKVGIFLKIGSPLARMRLLEVDAIEIEDLLLRGLCKWTGETVRKIDYRGAHGTTSLKKFLA